MPAPVNFFFVLPPSRTVWIVELDRYAALIVLLLLVLSFETSIRGLWQAVHKGG